MDRYKKYIQRLCRNGKYTPEEANQQAISRAVAEYYAAESETDPELRHEFTCLSET